MPVDNTILIINKKNYFNDVNSTIISLQVPMVCRSFTNVGRSGRTKSNPTKSNPSIDSINKTVKGKKLSLAAKRRDSKILKRLRINPGN